MECLTQLSELSYTVRKSPAFFYGNWCGGESEKECAKKQFSYSSQKIGL